MGSLVHKDYQGGIIKLVSSSFEKLIFATVEKRGATCGVQGWCISKEANEGKRRDMKLIRIAFSSYTCITRGLGAKNERNYDILVAIFTTN